MAFATAIGRMISTQLLLIAPRIVVLVVGKEIVGLTCLALCY